MSIIRGKEDPGSAFQHTQSLLESAHRSDLMPNYLLVSAVWRLKIYYKVSCRFYRSAAFTKTQAWNYYFTLFFFKTVEFFKRFSSSSAKTVTKLASQHFETILHKWATEIHEIMTCIFWWNLTSWPDQSYGHIVISLDPGDAAWNWSCCSLNLLFFLLLLFISLGIFRTTIFDNKHICKEKKVPCRALILVTIFDLLFFQWN